MPRRISTDRSVDILRGIPGHHPMTWEPVTQGDLIPTVEENHNRWTNYEWSDKGDEWSVGYGGTESMWSWAIQPRISSFLPSAHTLEIAPGFGRATQFILPASDKLTLVDLAEPCIEACKKRFEGHDNIEYHVNDGRS